MKIYNVIRTNFNGVVRSVDSFAVYEEQLEDDIKHEVEEFVNKELVAMGIDFDIIDDAIDNLFVRDEIIYTNGMLFSVVCSYI